MSNFFNIDLAVQCVRTIVDNNRCGICDKSEGSRARYACGHSACDDCVGIASDCLLCLTPSTDATQSQSVPDDPFTQKAKNASLLRKTFEDIYNIDIYKQHRLSEQLKLEKNLFPKCIQAPVKYCNKRKSSNILMKNKENRPSMFLGEQISPFKKLEMEKTAYVQQWLERNENKQKNKSPRKVFADLDPNCQNISGTQSTPLKKGPEVIHDKVKENTKSVVRKNRKRSHFKTARSMIDSQSSLDKYLQPALKKDSMKWKTLKKEVGQHENTLIDNKILNKDNNDESGIVMDDDPIVIDDSQSLIDKDKMAWLAVLNAEENANISDSTPAVRLNYNEIIKHSDDIVKPLSISTEIHSTEEKCKDYKVPFFKRSYLFKSCELCNVNGKKDQSSAIPTANQSKDVSITVESNNFVTTIKVTNTKNNTPRIINKHSTPVQTDIQGIAKINENLSMDISNINHSFPHSQLDKENISENVVQSPCLFTDEMKKVDNSKQEILSEFIKEPELKIETPKENKNFIITASDSEDDINESQILEVTADVHRSSELLDYGILQEMDEQNSQLRRRPVKRVDTPGSTDSSEKENCDPNKPKRMKFAKKALKKKKNKKHILFKPIL